MVIGAESVGDRSAVAAACLNLEGKDWEKWTLKPAWRERGGVSPILGGLTLDLVSVPPPMKTIQDTKECLSRAYVTAVVGKARHNLSWGGDHDYGVDGHVYMVKRRGTRRQQIGLGFAFQLKASTDWEVDGDEMVYDLESKTYNDMIAWPEAGATMPFFLVLLCLSKRPTPWITVSPDHLALRERALVFKVEGQPTTNAYRQRIRIPLKNVFSPAMVRHLIIQIAKGSIIP